MITIAKDILSTGKFPLGQWYPYLSLGSPFFVQYQSFSAILTGALGEVIGVHHAIAFTLYLLLALWPICVYWSGRLLGWGRWVAGVAAVMSPLLFSVTEPRVRVSELRLVGPRSLVTALGDVDAAVGLGLQLALYQPAALSLRGRCDTGSHHRLSLPYCVPRRSDPDRVGAPATTTPRPPTCQSPVCRCAGAPRNALGYPSAAARRQMDRH